MGGFNLFIIKTTKETSEMQSHITETLNSFKQPQTSRGFMEPLYRTAEIVAHEAELPNDEPIKATYTAYKTLDNKLTSMHGRAEFANTTFMEENAERIVNLAVSIYTLVMNQRYLQAMSGNRPDDFDITEHIKDIPLVSLFTETSLAHETQLLFMFNLVLRTKGLTLKTTIDDNYNIHYTISLDNRPTRLYEPAAFNTVTLTKAFAKTLIRITNGDIINAIAMAQ